MLLRYEATISDIFPKGGTHIGIWSRWAAATVGLGHDRLRERRVGSVRPGATRSVPKPACRWRLRDQLVRAAWCQLLDGAARPTAGAAALVRPPRWGSGRGLMLQ